MQSRCLTPKLTCKAPIQCVGSLARLMLLGGALAALQTAEAQRDDTTRVTFGIAALARVGLAASDRVVGSSDGVSTRSRSYYAMDRALTIRPVSVAMAQLPSDSSQGPSHLKYALVGGLVGGVVGLGGVAAAAASDPNGNAGLGIPAALLAGMVVGAAVGALVGVILSIPD